MLSSQSSPTKSKFVDPELSQVILCDPNDALDQWIRGLKDYQKFVGSKEELPKLSIDRLYNRGARGVKGIVIADLPAIQTRSAFGWCKYLGIKIIDDQKLLNFALPSIDEAGKIIFTRGLLHPQISPYSGESEPPYGQDIIGHEKFCRELSAGIAPLGITLLLCGMSKFCPVSLPSLQLLFIRAREQCVGGDAHLAVMVSHSSLRDVVPTEVRIVEVPDHPNGMDAKVNNKCVVIPTRVTFPLKVS